MRLLTILLVLAGSTRSAVAAPRRYAQQTRAERDALITRSRTIASLSDRLVDLSTPFLGTPYGHSPLGEGWGFDPDPLLRWDEVDCLTFVETSIALAETPSPDELLPILEDIRYGTLPPAFNRRNHFVESEWVPHNVAKGYIRSISREIAGVATLTVTKQFGPQLWEREHHPLDLKLAPKDIPSGTYSLDVVPLAFARAHADRIPSGTLLMVVRQDSPRVSTRVSHVGIVVWKNGKRYMRHASERPYERVVDEPLEKFFARNAAYTKWPVVGFAFFQVEHPSSRIARLVVRGGASVASTRAQAP